jgi:hypothetical protein
MQVKPAQDLEKNTASFKYNRPLFWGHSKQLFIKTRILF